MVAPLDGTWLHNNMTCGGTLYPGFLDGALLVATLNGSSLALEIRMDECDLTLALDAVFDAGTNHLQATPTGTIGCSASCNMPTVCGAPAASLVPGYSGTVTLGTYGFSLAGDDAARWPDSLCTGANLPRPGVHHYDSVNKPRVTYYVDQSAPGASNTACDGLSPTDMGGGHCPFLDLSAPNTAHWPNLRKTTVRIKAGTYVLNQYCDGQPCSCQGSLLNGGYTGLNITTPAGLDDAHSVIFEADGPVTLTGNGCTNCCDFAGTNPFDNKPIRLVAVGGSRVTFRGFAMEGAAYHDLTFGTHHGRVENCSFAPAAVADGDLLKGGGSGHVVVTGCTFDGFTDQAIDIAGPNQDWIIENNTFQNGGNGALGTKCGTRDVIFRNNLVRNLTNTSGNQLGAVGVGACSIDNTTVIQSYCGEDFSRPCFSAYNIQVTNNRFEDLHPGADPSLLMAAAIFYACDQCSFVGNTVTRADVGLFLNGVEYGDPMNVPADLALEHPAIEISSLVDFHSNDFHDVRRLYYGVEANAVSSYARTDSNRHCINPVDHPVCTPGNPASGADTAYIQGTPSTCGLGLGLGTLVDLEAAVGDVGDFFDLQSCPFTP